MTRKIVTWPLPFLQIRANHVTKVTYKILQFWRDMIKIMEDMTGVGLEAPTHRIGPNWDGGVL